MHHRWRERHALEARPGLRLYPPALLPSESLCDPASHRSARARSAREGLGEIQREQLLQQEPGALLCAEGLPVHGSG